MLNFNTVLSMFLSMFSRVQLYVFSIIWLSLSVFVYVSSFVYMYIYVIAFLSKMYTKCITSDWRCSQSGRVGG